MNSPFAFLLVLLLTTAASHPRRVSVRAREREREREAKAVGEGGREAARGREKTKCVGESAFPSAEETQFMSR